MSRSFTYQALALRVKPSGESNREAWFLTAEEGLLKATVFGGPKSRLRSQVASFHEGRLWIYHDPVRDSRKVSDFDVQSWRPGIREVWERAMAAGVLAETILASQGGGGNWRETLKLAGAVLDALDGAAVAACTGIAVYFLWHWAEMLGVKPDLSACACEGDQKKTLWYSARKEAVFCERETSAFTGPGTGWLRLDPGTRLWLKTIETLPPSALEKTPPEASSLEQAKALSQAVLAAALGKRLATWELC